VLFLKIISACGLVKIIYFDVKIICGGFRVVNILGGISVEKTF
jgi:hypothetical protein